jgi:hypothetical protein
MSSKEILSELISDASLLVQRQVQLARMEGEQSVSREKTVAKLMAAGGAIAYAGVVVLLVAAALALGQALGHLWLGALIVGGVLAIVGAALGGVAWSGRVRKPLAVTRRELDKEITWARDQVTT